MSIQTACPHCKRALRLQGAHAAVRCPHCRQAFSPEPAGANWFAGRFELHLRALLERGLSGEVPRLPSERERVAHLQDPASLRE